MSERVQVMMLQIVGFALIAGVVVLAAVLAKKGYAIPSALIAAIVSGAVGKLFGEPLAIVTLNSIPKLPPPLAASIAKRAIDSLPPNARSQLGGATVILEGLTSRPPPLGTTKQ